MDLLPVREPGCLIDYPALQTQPAKTKVAWISRARSPCPSTKRRLGKVVSILSITHVVSKTCTTARPPKKADAT
jgi:hypothetical protein